MTTPVEQLRNLGPRSCQWLRECGVSTVEELRMIGAVAAWKKLKLYRAAVSRNLLWGIAAGLQDRDWRDLTEAEKSALNREVDDAE